MKNIIRFLYVFFPGERTGVLRDLSQFFGGEREREKKKNMSPIKFTSRTVCLRMFRERETNHTVTLKSFGNHKFV